MISEDEEKMKGMMKRGMNSVINWDHATLQRPFPVRCCGLLQSISKPVSRKDEGGSLFNWIAMVSLSHTPNLFQRRLGS